MNRFQVLLTISVVFFTFSAFGQVRKFSNEFLTIPVNARGMAMSEAVNASVDDVSSAFYNPAGLIRLQTDLEVAFTHTEYFAGVSKYDYIAFALPFDDGRRSLALSMIRFAVDDIPNTLDLIEDDGSINYDNIKSFSVGDYAFLLTYAQKTGIENLNVGGNVKIVYRRAGSFANSIGFGIDIGGQYQHKEWLFAITAKDITTTFNAWSFHFTEEEKQTLAVTNNEIPENSLELTAPSLHFSAAYDYLVKEKFGILPEIKMTVTTDGKRNTLIQSDPLSIDLSLGLELHYQRIIFLRGGIGNFQRATDDYGEKTYSFQPNIGLGFKLNNFLFAENLKVDYAFSDIGNQSETLYSHVISIVASINRKNKQGK
ncbi:MAG: PorV/PorQ family protein [Chitinophagales bacterium]|nr:PorV/PorQ family protein [Chitinophagales bacterium]